MRNHTSVFHYIERRIIIIHERVRRVNAARRKPNPHRRCRRRIHPNPHNTHSCRRCGGTESERQIFSWCKCYPAGIRAIPTLVYATRITNIMCTTITVVNDRRVNPQEYVTLPRTISYPTIPFGPIINPTSPTYVPGEPNYQYFNTIKHCDLMDNDYRGQKHLQ